MKNILKEEINQIQYLFGYKRGVVISEQTDPIKRKIELSYEKGYADTAYYYTLLQSNKETEANNFKNSADFNNDHFNEIEKLYSDENPSLPKAETADLGKAPQNVVDEIKKTEDDILNLVQNTGKKEALSKELNTNRETKSIGKSKSQTISFTNAQTNYAKKTYSNPNVTLTGIAKKIDRQDDDGTWYTIVGTV